MKFYSPPLLNLSIIWAMIDLTAIDKTFLTRFLFALCFYWVWGTLAKGIFEPIQAHLGKQLIILTHKKTRELNDAAKLTCSHIDDFFLSRLADKLGDLECLVSGDVPPDDQQLFRELIAKNYDFEILLKKLDNLADT